MTELISPATAVMMVADPDDTPVSVFVTPGGILEWSGDSSTYPEFEIQFVGLSPVTSGANLKGNVNDPVVVRVKNEEGKFPYNILHTKSDGTVKITGPFAVRSCRVCS